jgi:chromosomal replication initiation ATPase DnaA
MSGKDDLVIFFQQLHKVISKVGYKKVLSTISSITLDDREQKERELFNKIIDVCANHFLIDKDEILLSKKRGNVSEARRMCFALMKNNLDITDGAIGEYIGGRSKQFVNNELKTVLLDESKLTTKYQYKFYNDYIKLNNEILKFKESI